MPFPPVCYNWNDGRMEPADYLHSPGTGIKGWYQAGIRRRKVKPFYHLVWPKDKDRGNFGRLKDIFQGKGPDIHLSISAQKNDHMTNRPLHGRWSHWETFDTRFAGFYDPPGQYTFKGPCWVSDSSKRYNFCSRKYEHYRPGARVWTDAIWQGPHKHTQWPDQFRDAQGSWWQDESWEPSDPFQKMSEI